MHLPHPSLRRPRRHLASVPARSARRLAVAGMLLATAALVTSPGIQPASLVGSSFEIDANANLKVDSAPNADWGSLAHGMAGDPEKRATDIASGGSDNSYKGGVKEDTVCPGETTGSIPNNKSDLLTFHVYEEPGTGNHPGFLNLAWSRVTDPSGTTLMDFEFNKGSLDDPDDQCADGPNVKRTTGDLLIEYALTQGGSQAVITKRSWTGSAWSNAVTLSAPDIACADNMNVPKPCAEGTVNTSTIAGADSDGVGERSPRTFGEAQIDLRALFGTGDCAAFGTATLKSRSSDSFTSQLKDFIAPLKVNIDNCGSITIRKQALNGDGNFSFDAVGAGVSEFQLSDDGEKVFMGLAAGQYTITETPGDLPAGWTLQSLVCSESGTGTTATEDKDTGVASITLGNGGDVVCTYTNHTKLSPTISTKLNGQSATLTVPVGSSVYDTAELSGATSDAGGTVTYTVYSNDACTQGARDAGSKSVTNGVVADSNSLAFNTAGTFWWQAVYSGDANNNGVTSACTAEVLTVSPASPTGSTAQSLIPNDTFTLSGGFQATGSVSFKLFGPGDASCSGAPAYQETVQLASNSAATDNDSFVAQTEGTWRWVVTYSGDTNNNGVTLACGEEQFTIDNDS